MVDCLDWFDSLLACKASFPISIPYIRILTVCLSISFLAPALCLNCSDGPRFIALPIKRSVLLSPGFNGLPAYRYPIVDVDDVYSVKFNLSFDCFRCVWWEPNWNNRQYLFILFLMHRACGSSENKRFINWTGTEPSRETPTVEDLLRHYDTYGRKNRLAWLWITSDIVKINAIK